MMAIVIWALTAVSALLAVMVVGLLRSHAVIIRTLHEAGFNLDPDAPAASPAPLRASSSIDLRTIEGVPGSAEVSGRRGHDITGMIPTGGARMISISGPQSTLLAFLSTGCGTCANFWNALRDGVTLPAGVRLVVVTKGGNEESPADVAALAASSVVTVMSSEAWDDYGVPVAPYFALVDGASGVVIGEGAAHGWALVEQMLNRAIADSERAATIAAATSPVSRRDMMLGRNRHRLVDADLAAAGFEPGDSRLFHASPYDKAVALDEVDS